MTSTRTGDRSPEDWDFWSFLTQKTVREIGVEIALWVDEGDRAIAADVLSAGDWGECLAQAFAGAELILDIAASVPVARHLSIDVDCPARRVSVFLNPQGTDVVVLAEDKHRRLTLDALE